MMVVDICTRKSTFQDMINRCRMTRRLGWTRGQDTTCEPDKLNHLWERICNDGSVVDTVQPTNEAEAV